MAQTHVMCIRSFTIAKELDIDGGSSILVDEIGAETESMMFYFAEDFSQLSPGKTQVMKLYVETNIRERHDTTYNWPRHSRGC